MVVVGAGGVVRLVVCEQGPSQSVDSWGMVSVLARRALGSSAADGVGRRVRRRERSGLGEVERRLVGHGQLHERHPTPWPAPCRRRPRPRRRRRAAAGCRRRGPSTPPSTAAGCSRRTRRRSPRWWCRSCRRPGGRSCRARPTAVPCSIGPWSMSVTVSAMAGLSTCSPCGAGVVLEHRAVRLGHLHHRGHRHLDAVVVEHAVGGGHVERRHVVLADADVLVELLDLVPGLEVEVGDAEALGHGHDAGRARRRGPAARSRCSPRRRWPGTCSGRRPTRRRRCCGWRRRSWGRWTRTTPAGRRCRRRRSWTA